MEMTIRNCVHDYSWKITYDSVQLMKHTSVQNKCISLILYMYTNSLVIACKLPVDTKTRCVYLYLHTHIHGLGVKEMHMFTESQKPIVPWNDYHSGLHSHTQLKKRSLLLIATLRVHLVTLFKQVPKAMHLMTLT